MKYLLLLILLIAVACSDKPEESADTPVGTSAAIFVKTAAVERTQVSPPILASGMVATSSEARVSFKTGGVIKRTFVEEGAVVAKGQLLAAIALTEIDAQVRQTKEGLAKAKRDLERAQNLHADSIATYEQVQNAGTAVDLATQNVQIAEFNRQFSEIRAPFHGKVVRQLLFEGEVTGPGMPVYYLMGAGSQDWILQVGLSDRDWARLQLGDLAKVTLDAYPGDTLPATVSQLAVVANPQSGTFDAELRLQPLGKAPGRRPGGLGDDPAEKRTYLCPDPHRGARGKQRQTCFCLHLRLQGSCQAHSGADRFSFRGKSGRHPGFGRGGRRHHRRSALFAGRAGYFHSVINH
ncbi:MAG: efflux RND transporter periplasmic adaptor subunit [Saprospirales bacterium]|nr:efflux RND transporter periplasmic adaptor subunit [Saprospirales bacterium]